MTVSGQFRLDQAAIDRLVASRDGPVGRMMAGFAGLATQEVRSVADERVRRRTGQYVAGIGSRFIDETTVRVEATASHSLVLEQGSRPHVITPRRPGGVLVFHVNGRKVFARKVHHPGTPAYNIVRDGVERAAERLSELAAR